MTKSASIVMELQRLAMNNANDITELLRKALAVATKLGLEDFRLWIGNELKGYPAEMSVPDYRKARASLNLDNPYHGLIPLTIPDEQITDTLCNIEIREPIAKLQHLVSDATSDHITVPLSATLTAWIMDQQDKFAPLPPVRTLSKSKVATMIDAVRTSVLEWALRLEQDGILGEALVFTEQEKQKAAASNNISIQNFQGILGNVTESHIAQDLQMTVSQGNMASLRKYLASKGVPDTDIDDLETAISKDPRPSEKGKYGPHVASWLGRMTSKAAGGAWQFSLSTAGSLLANALTAYHG